MAILRKCWTILKFIYLYSSYWLVGIPEESFYTAKGNYLVELNAYSSAIRSYEEALKESNDRRIHAMVGYCYSQLGGHKNAVEYYRKAFKKIPDQNIDIGLAISEFEAGNIDESETIIDELRRSQETNSQTKETLDNLEARIALVRKERESLKKYNK